MQYKQAHEYACIKCNQTSLWACSPYLCASFVQEFWSPHIVQCCSLFVHVHVQLLLLSLNISLKLSYLCTTSPHLSLISIKGVLLIDTKDCIGVDGWHLSLAFFYGHHHICWNDTTCIALEIPHIGSLTLILVVEHLPLCHSMGHPLDKLKLL